MKKFILTITILMLCITFNSYSSEWNTSFSKSLRIAQQENKMIILDFYTNWCGWCVKLYDEVFTKSKFINFAKNDFVLLKLNADKYPKLVEHYRIYSYPTVLILNNKGVEIDRVSGYLAEDNYIKYLNEKAYSIGNFYNLKRILKETNNENRHVFFKLGEAYYERRLYNDAYKCFLKSIDLDPNYGDSYVYLGNLSYIDKNPEKADYYYELARKNVPSNKNIDLEKAMNAYYNKYFARSLSCFDDILKNNNLSENETKNIKYYRILCNINLNNNVQTLKLIEELENEFADMKPYTKILRENLKK
ncbi:MAG: thioredoxin domain-containing protein [Candidatus Muirbacterium halophilum]|nr:thioredoxin domain-containing protein [Candidatus Muirbacterium halophilum]MCK9477317.1 thioredoxin domain-containing protein [Candidatus Muirbacterium halophilum]